MKKKYKHITIKELRNRNYNGRSIYEVDNNKTRNYVTILFYYAPYKKYVFESLEGKVFANTCLRDIIDFMEKELST